ncbi:unnamed protein product [Urochloa humidicola]
MGASSTVAARDEDDEQRLCCAPPLHACAITRRPAPQQREAVVVMVNAQHLLEKMPKIKTSSYKTNRISDPSSKYSFSVELPAVASNWIKKQMNG